MSTTVTITGSKARLARFGRAFGIAVAANGRTGTPELVLPVAPGCTITGAHVLSGDRVSGHRYDGRDERSFFCSLAELAAELRGWTPEKAAATLRAESAHRMERTRAIMAVDRRIA